MYKTMDMKQEPFSPNEIIKTEPDLVSVQLEANYFVNSAELKQESELPNECSNFLENEYESVRENINNVPIAIKKELGNANELQAADIGDIKPMVSENQSELLSLKSEVTDYDYPDYYFVQPCSSKQTVMQSKTTAKNVSKRKKREYPWPDCQKTTKIGFKFVKMFKTDKFIKLVHGQPSLWDKSCKDYSNRVQRDKSWLSVAIKMFKDWNDVDMREKDIRGKELRKKWRHIRDEFYRQMNKSKTGDPPSKKKKTYVWAEALNFLQNSATKRNTSRNLEAVELDEESDDNVVDIDIAEDQQVNESETDVVPTPTLSSPKTKTLIRKNSKLTPFQEQLLNTLDTSTKSEDDADRMFLLSMLPDYKELDNEEKLDFKLMALQFFRSARQKKRFQSQFPTGPQFDSNVYRNQQQQYYKPQTSKRNRSPTTVRPSSTQSLPDNFFMPLQSPNNSRIESQQNSVFSS